MTDPCRLIMWLVLRKGRLLRFRLFQITLIFLGCVTSKGLTTSLTTSLTGGLKEDEGTKIVELGADTFMISTKPNLVLLKGDFWTLRMWSSLELADLSICSQKPRGIVQNKMCFLFLPFFINFFLYKLKKLEWNAWMLCYADPKKNNKNKEQWSQRVEQWSTRTMSERLS